MKVAGSPEESRILALISTMPFGGMVQGAAHGKPLPSADEKITLEHVGNYLEALSEVLKPAGERLEQQGQELGQLHREINGAGDLLKRMLGLKQLGKPTTCVCPKGAKRKTGERCDKCPHRDGGA